MPFDPDAEVFPQELFALIAEAAMDDRRSLREFSLVSKSFLSISQRCLYRRVRLGGLRVVSVNGKRLWRVFDTNNDSTFLKTLTITPHLAHYVRDFSFRPDAGHMNEHFWDNFHRALHLMVNLRYFQLTLMTPDGTFYRLLQGLCDQPFQLEVFSWKDYRRKMTDQDIAAFLAFIASQPHLRAIDVLSSSASLILPSANCPNLTTFIGDYEVAASVLQDHSVTNFVWMRGQLESSLRLGPDWALGFSNLRVLVFYDQFPLDVDLAVLASNLSSLEALQISFESTIPSGRTFNKAMEILVHLPKLKKLRVFAWNSPYPDSRRVRTPNAWLDAFDVAKDKLFDSPCLERVYLGRPTDNGGHYLRWNGKGLPSLEVSVDDLAQFCNGLDFDSSLVDRRFIYGQ